MQGPRCVQRTGHSGEQDVPQEPEVWPWGWQAAVLPVQLAHAGRAGFLRHWPDTFIAIFGIHDADQDGGLAVFLKGEVHA